jgi:peroxiredoxin Q/BCP
MRYPWLVLVLGLALVLVGVVRYARAADEVTLAVGDAAPGFSLPGSDGATHRLADLKGHSVVLAWFPKAFTGG